MAWYFRNKLFFRNKEFEHAWTKKKKKQICPEWRRINTHRDSNILFEHHIFNSKITIFD